MPAPAHGGIYPETYMVLENKVLAFFDQSIDWMHHVQLQRRASIKPMVPTHLASGRLTSTASHSL